MKKTNSIKILGILLIACTSLFSQNIVIKNAHLETGYILSYIKNVNFIPEPVISFVINDENCTAFGKVKVPEVIALHSSIRISKIQCNNIDVQVRGHFLDKNKINGALATIDKKTNSYTVFPQNGFVSIEIETESRKKMKIRKNILRGAQELISREELKALKKRLKINRTFNDMGN